MALSIGELVGFIRIDPSGVDEGLNRAETRVRQTGDEIGAAAGRAGQQAGDNLGAGLIRGADGSIRDAQGRLVTAGRTAGDGFGDGLSDGATSGADEAAEGTVSKMDKVKVGLAAVGVAAGAALMSAMTEAMDQDKIVNKLAAGMGKTPAEAQKYGKIAGSMYADAITEDFQGAADAIGATMAAGLTPPEATNAQIKSIATNLSDLSDTFELDLGQSANAVGQIMKTGLAPNAKVAMDVLTKGLQTMGPRADDIADTFNEYSTIFRQMGISAADATGIMAQGMAAGARDTDVVADALKEFVLIAQAGEEPAAKAFKSIGLNGKAMQKAFTEGGPKSKEALDKVFDALRKVKDPAERSSLAMTLFGTKAEDMQKALFAIDPSKAAAALGKTAGAADKMGKTLRDSAGVQIEQFKRRLQQGLVNVMGSQVIPVLLKIPGYARQVGQAFQTMASFVMNNKAAFIAVGSVITAIILPSLVSMAVTAATSAATTIAAWVASAGAAISTGATYVGVNALIIAGWVRQAAAAIAAGARVVATWVLMGVQSMIRAAQMAAAWIIAMGPVGWVIAAIVGLVALIIANWDKVKSWTAAAWDWVWSKIKAVAGFIWNLFLNWTLYGLIIKHWDKIKAATLAAWDWVWDKIKTIGQFIVTLFMNFSVPGLIIKHWDTIKSATKAAWDWVKNAIMTVVNAVKSFISSAFNAIKSVISGAWNSIKSLTSTVWGAIKSVISSQVNLAKSAVSGAVSAIKGFFSSGFNAIKTTVSGAISNVVSTIKGLSGKVKGAVSGAASWLVSAGKSIIQGLINGITSMKGAVGDAVKGVLKGARDYLPFSPAKKGPFSGKGWTLYSGRAITEALAKGILQRRQKVSDAMKRAAYLAKRHQVAINSQSTRFQTGQGVKFDSRGNELTGVQNGYGGKTLQIQNYYESNRGSAKDTALELEWLAKARG